MARRVLTGAKDGGRKDPPPLDPLSRFAIKHGADKWGLHLYTPIYHRFFQHLRERPVRLLEVGVGGYGIERQGGPSLRMWADYFPQGRIVGVDLHRKTLDMPERVTVLQADQTDPATLRAIWDAHGPFDIVIDDASHRARETVTTFDILFPLLEEHALYVVEDLHCAFGPNYGGQSDGAGSIIARLQGFVRDLHDREIAVDAPGHPPSRYGGMIRGLHLFLNLAIIERGTNAFPSLFTFDLSEPEAAQTLQALRALPRRQASDGSAHTEAAMLRAGGRLAAARGVAADALRRWPDSRLLLWAAQQWAAEAGDPAAQREVLEHLVHLEPDDALAACLLAANTADLGRMETFGAAADALDAPAALEALAQFEAGGGHPIYPSLYALRALLEMRAAKPSALAAARNAAAATATPEPPPPPDVPRRAPSAPAALKLEAPLWSPAMSDDATPRLGLPYLAAAQAQKHVTLNEALAALDGLVQCAVESRTLTAQPTSPAEGAAYLIPTGASGDAWAAAAAGAMLRFEAGGWSPLTPPPGALVYVRDEGLLLLRGDAAWLPVAAALGNLDGIERLGVGATADATNRLSVASAAVLLSHAGHDMRAILNKATSADTASLLFQDGFSGRAEVGLTGDDALRVKVSPDGASWTEALNVDPTSGEVRHSSGRLSVFASGQSGSFASPPGAWAAKFTNARNSPTEHGVVVSNMWFTPASWAFLVGSSNNGVSPAGFKSFFGVKGSGQAVFANTVQLAAIPKASLPSASDAGAGALAFVPDDSAGATVAFSDGSVWRRVHDRSPVA